MKLTTIIFSAFYATLASTSPSHVLLGRQTGGLCVAGGVCLLFHTLLISYFLSEFFPQPNAFPRTLGPANT
jgi:hypothetical protein